MAKKRFGKKVISLILVALVLVSCLTACTADSKDAKTNSNIDYIASIDQLNDEKYTIVAGIGTSAYFKAMERLPNAKLIEGTTLIECLLDVQRGIADGFVFGTVELQDIMNSGAYPELALASEMFGTVDNAVAIPKGSTEMKTIMDAFINQVKGDGTYDEMYNRWINEGNTTMPEIETPSNPSKHYVIATSGEIKPYNYIGDSGEVTGFDVELIKRFAIFANADVEIQVMSFPAMISSLQSGKIDAAISNFNITPERQEVIDFSIPYHTETISLCVKRERLESGKISADQITDYEQLLDKKIGVILGSIFEGVVKTINPNQQVVYCDSFPDMVQALLARKIDAYIVEEPMALYQIRENKDSLVMLHFDPLGTEDTGFILKKGNTELKDKLNSALAKFKENGYLNELQEKWIYSIESDASVDPELYNYVGPNGTLKVDVDATNEGFAYIQNGLFSGYEVELIMAMAKENGYSVEFEITKFAGLIPAISSGKCDVGIGVITITEERTQSVDFTDPILSPTYVAIVRKELVEEEKVGFFESLKESFVRTFITESRWKMVLEGLLATIIISVSAVVIGSILGFFFSFALRSENKFVRGLSNGLTSILTGMPVVVILMLLYYVLFAKSSLPAVIVAILGFSIDFCCAVAGILNTGIAGVSDGQKRAALALGYNKMQVFTKIVFPQAATQMFDQYKASIVGLVKSTSIAGYITVEELTRISDIIRSRTYEAFFPLIATAILYFIITRFLIRILGLLGNKINPETRKKEDVLAGIDLERETLGAAFATGKGSGADRPVLIQLKHLEKAYPGVTPLKDVNAEIRKGDVIVIVGPSGTGKSTLLNCINQLDPPTNGEVWIEGIMANDPKCNLEKLRQKVGMVFQSFNLFEHKTVIENVMMAPMNLQKMNRQVAYERAMDLLNMVGMGQRALYYPKELSGGQKQRAAIARTLAMNPDIILLDEPTSALDPASVGEVKSVVKNLSEMGQTMLIVTHDMAFAREVANRVFYMDEGIIYDDDTPAVIFDNPVKERTKAFIKRKKAFVQSIKGNNFDFIKAKTELLNFSQQNWWTKEQLNRAYCIFDEVCDQLLRDRFGDSLSAEFVINYYEKDGSCELTIDYEGEEFNALTQSDDIQRKLIMAAYKTCRYSYDGVNHLSFK